jgi:hypothetical protein
MFELSGGSISLADGWRHGPEVSKNERWAPADVGSAVADLLGQAQAPEKVYGT